MAARKGIVLAGGTGSRLFPLTRAVSKQLLPVYDKPMIHYPLSVLVEAGIEEIAIITNPQHLQGFRDLLGDGSDLGLRFVYIPQQRPEGLAQAYLLAERFLDGAPSAMALGDNLFCGGHLAMQLSRAAAQPIGGTVFSCPVADPRSYGVVTMNRAGHAVSIEEKPQHPRSDQAVTGLYFLDGTASRRARAVRPSARGELEITCLLQSYLDDGLLRVEPLGPGCTWFDTGNPDTLLDAANFVRTQTQRGGQLPGCIEETAFRRGLIGPDQLARLAHHLQGTRYGQHLMRLTGNAEQRATRFADTPLTIAS